VKHQNDTSVLLVGPDIDLDSRIQNKLLLHGYLIECVTSEQDLITRICKKQIDFIIISNIQNSNTISDNIINNINIPILVLRTLGDLDLFLLDVQKKIITITNIFNDR
jgi:hypothetical protein